MKALKTIILAAGKGTRMKSDVPKVLHKVGGREILSYVLGITKAVGSLKTYVVVGHKSEDVKKFLGHNFVSVVQKKLLGTADAVRCTQRYLAHHRGDVLILCGDTPLLRSETIKSLLQRHRRSSAVCTVLTAVVHDPKGYGRIIRDDKGAVVAIREDKDATGLEQNISEINVGVYCVGAKELFRALKNVKLNEKKREFYLTDIFEFFAKSGLKVESFETEEAMEGLGVNTREDLAVASDVIRHRVLKNLMQGGVTIIDPETTYIDASVKIGNDTVIKPFTVIDENVKIGKRCLIGPFAHLRAGTRIADRVEIGNFTEVSRTQIGSQTLMKHFSFLGDAVIGSQVNIGAGTVTANFDGRNKNVTRIGNGAFIGSDSVLVAPVKIGRKAVLGAGSVLTRGKSISDGGIAYGVPAKQIGKGRLEH